MSIRNKQLDPAKLSVEEAKLLDEWAGSVPGFIRDGVVDVEKYCKAPLKILVVLKEVNGGSDWDLREFLKGGGRAQTWNVVARWIENIFNLKSDYAWSELQSDNDARRMHVLPYICVAQLISPSMPSSFPSKDCITRTIKSGSHPAMPAIRWNDHAHLQT